MTAPGKSDALSEPDPLTRAIVAALLALGALASPLVLGAAFLLVSGEMFSLRADRAESWRGRVWLAIAGAASGLAAWLSPANALVVCVSIALVLVVLGSLPVFLADARLSVGAALARALDRTLRARVRDLVPSAAVAGFVAFAPGVVAVVWHFGSRNGRPFEALAPACVGLHVVVAGAVLTTFALGALARDASVRGRHHAPVSRLGVALTLALLFGLVWAAATAPALARSDGHLGVSYPTGAARVGDGAVVWFRRDDGAEMGLLMHHAGEQWWIDAIEPTSIDARRGDTRFARATPYGDDRVAAMHLSSVLALVPLAIAAVWLVWARGGWFRDRLRRSHVVRARFRAADLANAEIPAGAELTLAGGLRVKLAAQMRVDGADVLPAGDWIESALIAPRAWSPDPDYRSVPRPPPPGAHLVVGDLADAVVLARIEDTQRALRLGALIASLGVVTAMWLASLG